MEPTVAKPDRAETSHIAALAGFAGAGDLVVSCDLIESAERAPHTCRNQNHTASVATALQKTAQQPRR